MTWVLTDTISETFVLESLATGQTFTRLDSRIDNVPMLWNPAFTEIGDGAYSYSYTPSVAGVFSWVGTATNGEVITINFDVDAARSNQVVVVTPAPPGAFGQSRSAVHSEFLSRGDSIIWELPILDESGDPVDLTGATVWFTVKQRFNQPDADAVISSSWIDGGASSGITVDDPTSGEISYGITAAQSSDLIASLYHADVQVLDANANVTTVWRLRLAIGAGVTDGITVMP